MQSEDFKKSHFPFLAAILREGEQVKYHPNCTTIDGFLCRLEAKKNSKGVWVNKFLPLFDGRKISDEQKQTIKNVKTMQDLPEESSVFLFKFGKHGDTWVWNQNAVDKRKIEEKKTVTFKKVYREKWDDDEDEYKFITEAFPKNILELVEKHCVDESGRGQKKLILNDATGLETALKAIGWNILIR